MPDVDLTWDEMAFLLARIGVPRMKVERALRLRLIRVMTHYDGNTSNRMSPDIKRRVEYWEENIRLYSSHPKRAKRRL